MDTYLVHQIRPLFAKIDRIGPFLEPTEIDFTDKSENPCNLFMILSVNGRGKTTLLNTFSKTFNLLGQETVNKVGIPDIDTGNGQIQIDFLLELEKDDCTQKVIFSLGASGSTWLQKRWTQNDCEKYGAETWIHLIYERSASGYSSRVLDEDEILKGLLFAIQSATGNRPFEVLDTSLRLPCLLFFSAYRNIFKIDEDRPIAEPENWGYKITKTYNERRYSWLTSPDNLLVWLKWLDANNLDSNLSKLIEFLNTSFFETAYNGTKRLKGIRAQPPGGEVYANGKTHALDLLSSGEKSILQLLLSIASDLTGNTIILIDELDVHLHPTWQHLVLVTLKKLIKSTRGLTIIFTTHSESMIETLDIEFHEDNLIKGGFELEDANLS